jgi:hypothetical protein
MRRTRIHKHTRSVYKVSGFPMRVEIWRWKHRYGSHGEPYWKLMVPWGYDRTEERFKVPQQAAALHASMADTFGVRTVSRG